MESRRLALLLMLPLSLLSLLGISGCGTTRASDTSRTATEQLLISDAIDRSVEAIDFQLLAGHAVYFDDQRLSKVVDKDYLISTLRQHLLAHGCVLKEYRDDAEFVVEARAGAVGTDNHNLLFGIPAMNVPQIVPLQGVPSAIPEVAVAKRQDQRAVAKVAVFAYHRETGVPVWQSGLAVSDSTASGIWLFGAGPFQKGTIYEGTQFAGQEIQNPLLQREGDSDQLRRVIGVKEPARFNSPQSLDPQPAPAIAKVESDDTLPKPEPLPPLDNGAVQTAGHVEAAVGKVQQVHAVDP